MRVRAALPTLLVLACSGATAEPTLESDPPTTTAAEEPPVTTAPPNDNTSGDFEWLMLRDVQGLYGGRVIYVLPDGSLVAQKVMPGPGGLHDQRSEGSLDADGRRRLADLLVEHELRTMEVPSRLGVPDESLAVLTVRFRDGAVVNAQKWNGVAHAGFSAIYGHLMGIATELAPQASAPVRYDHGWRPEGVNWSP